MGRTLAIATWIVLWIAPAVLGAEPPAKGAEPRGVSGTRAGISDAWISSDAAVIGTYRGPDSTLGAVHHVLDVAETWLGTPARGRLVFKAPRGIRGEPGSRMLLFLWDRLAGVSDSFIEESKRRYGDDVWKKIGPDSLAVYLLPFAVWSYPYEKNELVLRGQSVFPVTIGIDKLHSELQELERSLEPAALYARAEAVVRARVDGVVPGERVEYGVVVERWVVATFRRLEAIKGDVPESLEMRFVSVPRSPRFVEGDEVILFLARGPEGLYLDQGKRCVLHVEKGEVLEAGQPLGEFLKALRGS